MNTTNSTTLPPGQHAWQIPIIISILHITSRAELVARYDKGIQPKDLTPINGIGPQRARLLVWLLSLDAATWIALTGMAA